MKPLEKDKELLKLKDEAYKVLKEFNQANERLKKGYFYEIDAKVKDIEEKTKERFLNVIGKDIRNTLVDFKFNYDPFNMNISSKIKMMKINNLYYDLGYIAFNHPQEKRTHEMLNVIDKDYKNVHMRMQTELIDLGLHPSSRPCAIQNIENFLDSNRIFGIVPEFYI